MKNLNGEEINHQFGQKQKKLKIWQIVLICTIGLGIIGGFPGDSDEESSQKERKRNSKEISSDAKLKKNAVQICDGINIIENCELNGNQYTLYKYYPAVEEKSHAKTVTKYKEEIVGYCTLCNDGTYSPTCATGRGACSHHGGVAQWNAPVYDQVAYYEEVKVIDTPAVAERYEIIEKN
jgi:hypothetical protein